MVSLTTRITPSRRPGAARAVLAARAKVLSPLIQSRSFFLIVAEHAMLYYILLCAQVTFLCEPSWTTHQCYMHVKWHSCKKEHSYYYCDRLLREHECDDLRMSQAECTQFIKDLKPKL